MRMKLLLEVEVEAVDGAEPNGVVSGIIDKLGDGELTVPSGSSAMASLEQAQIKELRSYNKANQTATW